MKGLGFHLTGSTKTFEIYKGLDQLKEYRDEKQQELANRFMSARLDGDLKEMVAVRHEAMEWNRAAVQADKREMRIDLDAAIQARKRARQPMKQLRGVARDLRKTYGM